MPITFACQNCQKKYRVKDELAGKTAKCGACDTRMKIPAPVAAVAAPLPDLQDLSSGLAPQPDLGDFFDEALSPSTTSSSSPAKSSNAPVYSRNSSTKLCSTCGNTLDSNAVLCTKCGFDLRTNKKIKTEKTTKPSRVSAAAQQTASLGQGALFSAIGAALGTAAWLGIVVLTGYESAWIAWGLGAAAGVGMSIGHEDDDGSIAGLIAAGISVLGIVAAKFFAFEYFKSVLVEEGMSLIQLEAVPFTIMFHPMDGLFFILAIASAYKIGSGQETD